MKRLIIPWVSFLCLPFLAFTQDLNCGLDSRWELQSNAGIQTFTIEVDGYLNDQLSNPGQGLCGVEIGFLHSAIRDLEIWLESPAGQRIQLIGPNDAGSRAGLGANWQVTFVPSTQTAEPMPGGYAAQWDNNQNAELTVTGFGTYYPFDNNFRLEDFNLGSVNGTWTVEVRTDPTSAFFSPVGYIYNFRLVFCDESGTSCCFAEAGNLAGDGVSACQGDPSLDIAPPEVRYVFSIRPDELLYSYSYLVAQGEALLEQTDDPDFTGYAPGEYQVYGLSYRITDEIIVQTLNLNDWTLSSLRSDLVSDLPLFCGDITTDSLHVQIISPEAAIASPKTLLCARPEVTLDGRGSTPGGVLTYEWLDESGNTLGNSSLQTVDSPGVYRLVVSMTGTDCGDTATVEVLADFNNPVADAGASRTLTCDQPEQLIGSVATSSGMEFIYQWHAADGYFVSRSDTIRPLVNAAGTYVLEVIDTLNGCSATDSVVVTENFAPPAADAGTAGTLTCADTEWTLGGTGTSFGPDFIYAWTTPDGNFTTPVDILQPVADAPGTYILEVTNTRNGCVATDTVKLTENTTPPSADAGPPATLTCEVPEVTLGGPGTDLGPGFSYQWSTPDGRFTNTDIPRPATDSPGTYILLVMDNRNGCTAKDTMTVDQDITPPIADAGPEGTLTCDKSETRIGGDATSDGPGFRYDWSTPDGRFATAVDIRQPSVDAPGIYTLLVTDLGNGCQAQDDVVVDEDRTAPAVDPGPAMTLTCNDSQLHLNGSNSDQGSGFTYEWQTLDGNILEDSHTLRPLVDQAGTYELRVTNTANGCSNAATVTVNADLRMPRVLLSGPPLLNCERITVDLDGTASDSGSGFSFFWRDLDGGGTLVNDNTLTPSTSSPGRYELVVIDENNGCRDSATVMVRDTMLHIVADPGTAPLVTCSEPSVLLDGSGSTAGINIIYQWSTNGGQIDGPSDQAAITVSAPGAYQLLVRDTFTRCESVAEVIVASDTEAPLAEAGPDKMLDCSTTEVVLVGSGTAINGGALRYEWSGPCVLAGAATSAATVNCEGTYYLLVENTSNGCTALDSVVVIQDADVPSAVISPPDTLTCDARTITLDATSSPNGNRVVYQWSGPGIVSGESGLGPIVNESGLYTLSVTNVTNNCVGTAVVEVFENTAPPGADAGEDQLIDCTNPVVIVGDPAADPGFSYDWSTTNGVLSGPDNQPALAVDIPGDYILRVTDPRNGCSAEDRVTVDRDVDTPFANAGPDRELNCSVSMVTLNGGNSIPGPAPQIIYEWTGDCLLTDPGNSTMEVDCPGMYYLSITNTRNGCTSVDSVLVRRDDAGGPQATLADTAYIDCESGEALLNGSSSTGGFFTWWRNGELIEQGDQSIRVTDPGDYQLIIDNPSLGCSDTAAVEVLLDCQPEAVILVPDTLTCRRDIVTIDATASSAGSVYRYQWTSNAPGCIIDGADSPRLRVRCAGDFTLVVTNTAVQRSDTAQVRVEADTTSPVAVVALSDTITCEEPSVALDATGSSTGSVFDYFWSDSNGDTISRTLTATANHSGAYLFEVVNRDNGCRSVDFAVVIQDGAVPEITFGSDIIPCQQDTFRLKAKVEPTGGNYNYQWTGPGILADADAAAVLIDRPGDYQLAVLNPDNGCAGQATVTVTEEGCSPCIETQIPDTIDCVTASVRLEAQFCDDCSGCTIQWSTGSGVIIDGAETLTPLVGAAATYTLRVTNALGFTAERRVTVLEDRQPPEVAAGPDRNLTCASPVLTLEPAASTILDNYRYEWLDESGSIRSVQQPLPVDHPGRYILAVTNEINGCRATDTTDIGTDTIPPVAEAGSNRRLTCEDAFVTLDGAGSSLGATIRYEWSAPGSGSILTGASTPNPTVNAAGVYQLTVRELRNGCTATDSVTVEQQDELPLLPDIGETTLTCDRPALVFDGTVTGPGNYLYEWCRLDGAGNPVDCTVLPERTVDTPGRYRYEITDAATGCTNSLVIAIDEDRAIPQVEAGGGGTLGCGDDGFPLQGSAGPAGVDLSFQWTASGGGFIEGADTLAATAFAPGTYTLTATNRINGCSASDSVTIDRDEAAPQVEVALPPRLTCSHSEVTLAAQASTVSGRIQWEWQAAEGLIISGADTGTPLVGTPGRYEVRVTDPANGCSSISAVMVEENTMAPVAVIDSSGGLFFSCDSNQVTLDGRPSVTVSDAMLLYSWRVLSGNSIIGNPTDAMVAVDQAGLYRLVVTSMENGCRDTLDVLIQEDPDLPVIDIVPPSNITCSRPEVTIDAGASSSGPDFRYTWRDDSGAVLAEVPELSVRKAGTYELLLRNDATGCADSAVVEVSADTLKPVARIAPVGSLDCQTERIELDGGPSSSGPDIIYGWSTASGNIIDGQDRAVAVVDAPGLYILAVRNLRNGCESTAPVTVDQASDPIEEVFVQVMPPSCSGDDTGTIRVDSVHGGTGPYVYALADDLFTTRSAFSGIPPGAYTLRVQDSNGCEWEEVVTVPDARALSVDLGADILVDLGESVRLEAVISGGNFDRLTWSPAEAFSLQGKPVQIISPSKTATYSVTVEWQGCRATDFVTVTVRKARQIYMPTAFSPNGDGNNDVFFLQTGPEVREIKSFMIFDRWGNKVYENGPFPPNDPTYGWDGTLDGQPMNAAVFVFFAEVEFVDGWVEMVKGDVALMR